MLGACFSGASPAGKCRGLGPAPLLHLEECKESTRTSVLSAAWRKENVADKYSRGRRKAAQIDICALSPALGWKENRACKMLGPSCPAKAKALWRDPSPDSDLYSWHVGTLPLSSPVPSPPPCPGPREQTSNTGDSLTR